MLETQIKLFDTRLENVFKLLVSRFQSEYKTTQQKTVVKDDYSDKIVRKVTYRNSLMQPHWDDNKLILQEHYFISVFPGKTDIEAEEVITTITLDALVFTGWQLQTNTVQIKLEYLEHWIDLANSILSELLELFPKLPCNFPDQEKSRTIREIADTAAGTITVTGALNPGWNVALVPTGGNIKPIIHNEQSGQAEYSQGPNEPQEHEKEDFVVVSERTKALNKLARIWVNYNQTQRVSKDDDMEWFLGENAKAVGLEYVSVAEFKKHLPKAVKAKVIEKDKRTGRFIPKSGT